MIELGTQDVSHKIDGDGEVDLGINWGRGCHPFSYHPAHFSDPSMAPKHSKGVSGGKKTAKVLALKEAVLKEATATSSARKTAVEKRTTRGKEKNAPFVAPVSVASSVSAPTSVVHTRTGMTPLTNHHCFANRFGR